MARLTAGWVMRSNSAACEADPASITALKVSNCR
jgi:hypothetical protein